MGKPSAYAITFQADRYQYLLEELHEHEFFAEAVDDFQFSKYQPLVAIVVDPDKQVTHIGRARKGVRAATGKRRLNLENLIELNFPIPIEQISSLAATRSRSRVQSILEDGGLFTPKAFLAVVDALVALDPGTGDLLDKFSTSSTQRLSKLSAEVKTALAYQKETIASALEFSGIGRETIGNWELKGTDAPISYLEGLPEARLLEDAMIEWDLHSVPGFDEVQSLPHVSTAIFRNDETTLHVTLANKRPLEHQTGADLIYFNQTFGSFVMVQYKAMEQDEKRAALFRFPQSQLTEEIERMDRLLDQLSALSVTKTSRNFRLNENPFYLKFCPRIQKFEPNSTALTSGMYIPLDLWKRLEADSSLNGPRGGKSLTYQNVGRFVDNGSFAMLVERAWIGTTINASKILAEWIRHISKSGRSITLAIKKDDGDDDAERGYVYDPNPTLDQENDQALETVKVNL